MRLPSTLWRPWPRPCRRSGHRSTIGIAARLRATYYGAQREVDDGLGRLFDYLEESGLASRR